MSSNYKAICLGHNPALIIASGSNYREWNNPADALNAIENREGPLEDHPKCDIIVGRYSSPLIEIICPGSGENPCTHPGEKRIDVNWLRLMIANLDDPNPMAASALERFRGGCWYPNRVRRLRNLITE